MARKFKTPITIDELGSASSQALAANVDGDSQNRINIDAGGKITWGSGSATGDTTLYRSAADTLKTDDAFTATSLAVTGQFTLPTSDGSADQIITTNGSGTLTWSDVSANATVSDAAPSSPATGQIWYESDTGKTFVYYDSFWVEVGASPPAAPFITDLDEDTKIQVEESSDEDKIRFDTAGSERMIIDASGNVGIGTTTPGQALVVAGRIVANHTGNAFPLSVQSDQSTSGIILSDAGTTINVVLRSNGNDFQIRTNSDDRVTVDSSGNVGIGTTSPSHALDVNGKAIVGGGDNQTPDALGNGHLMIDGSGYTGFASLDGTAMWLGHNSGSRSLYLATDETARVTVTGTGSVGIGDTAPNSQLEVVSTSQRAFRFERSEDVGANNVTCGIMEIGTDTTNPGTDDYWILFRRGDATTIGSVRGTGSASVNFSTTSDSTLKTDRGIVTASRIGTIIDGLEVHEFDWNEGDVNGQIGLFAQEAIDVLPESIVNAPTTMPGDEEGDDDEYVPAALDYSKIVPILIAECQFLRARVATLEAE